MTLKRDFPFFEKNPNIKYFDNAATSLRPIRVIDAIKKYYDTYSTNAHNKSSELTYSTYNEFNNIRKNIAKFLNAHNPNEIIFVPSSTYASNQISFGLKEFLNEKDNIIISQLEHVSNILPWYRIAKEKKVNIRYCPMIDNKKLDIENIKNIIDDKTKIVALASTSNTMNYNVDVKKITKIIKDINPNIIVVIDAAQSIAHTKINVQKWGCDFVYFSAHKMWGPNGVGVLWGKENILKKLKPIVVGGGTSWSVDDKTNNWVSRELPDILEPGSSNLGDIFGLNEAINFINDLGYENIAKHGFELKQYFNKQYNKHLKDKIIYYNYDSGNPVIIFNVKNKNPEDVASFLGGKNIIVRAGDMCAKILLQTLNIKSFIRVSFSIYNNKEEIDYLINILKNEEDFIENI